MPHWVDHAPAKPFRFGNDLLCLLAGMSWPRHYRHLTAVALTLSTHATHLQCHAKLVDVRVRLPR